MSTFIHKEYREIYHTTSKFSIQEFIEGLATYLDDSGAAEQYNCHGWIMADYIVRCLDAFDFTRKQVEYYDEP